MRELNKCVHGALNIHVFDVKVRTSTSNANNVLYSDEKRSEFAARENISK